MQSLLYPKKKKMKETFGNDDDDLTEKVLELDPGNTTLQTYI